MKAAELHAKKGRFRIDARVMPIGDDLLVAIWGGTRPHIGAVGIALPRPSLANAKRWSATSSNFTFQGHKEDLLVKEISETLAAALRKNVVVTAGMHWDNLAPRDFATIQELVRGLTRKISGTHQRRGRST
jgi:gallate decarboxylase subunit D